MSVALPFGERAVSFGAATRRPGDAAVRSPLPDAVSRRVAFLAALSLACHVLVLVVWAQLSGGAASGGATAPSLEVRLVSPRTVVAASARPLPEMAALHPTAPTPPVSTDAAATPSATVADTSNTAPRYLLARTLDRTPRPIGAVEPQYPVEAGGVQGTVVLRVLVNETGIADAVEVVRASPEGFFEQAAKDAFLNARFVPGEKRGVPVKSQLLIEVSFSTYNKGAAVEPQFR